MGLYLTYNNGVGDGIGAQALRQTALFALTRFTGTKYIHSDILEISEEFAHESNFTEDKTTSANQIKKLFTFPSDLKPSKFDFIKEVENLNWRTFLRFYLLSFVFRKNILLKVLLPFKILDRAPFIYKYAKTYIQNRMDEMIDHVQTADIVVHARYGYGAVWNPSASATRRIFLKPSYFTKVISELSRRKKIPIPARLKIHTDLSPTDVEWTPRDPRTLQMFREIARNELNQKIVIRGRNLSEEFPSMPNMETEIVYCGNTWLAFVEMCRAPILVMGRSAFSYLAGLVNGNLVIAPTIHGHSHLPGWLSEKDLGIHIENSDLEKASDWQS